MEDLDAHLNPNMRIRKTPPHILHIPVIGTRRAD
jgi:hypothetical protein